MRVKPSPSPAEPRAPRASERTGPDTPPAPPLLARLLLGAIRLYQRTLSPVLPVVTLGRCACRFAPTCSHYAAEAIRVHGPLRGVALAAWRLLRCTPLTRGGFDPVPSPRPRAARPVCQRSSPPIPRASPGHPALP
jgi:putative membrane protein insertion efficiency factor